MTDESFERFEESLRRFRPRSTSEAARRQVIDRMRARRHRIMVVGSIGALVAAVAASLVLKFAIPTSDSMPAVVSTESTEGSVPAQVDLPKHVGQEFISPAPTLWTYRRAADASSDEFGSLLSRHAAELLPRESGPVVASSLGARDRHGLE